MEIGGRSDCVHVCVCVRGGVGLKRAKGRGIILQWQQEKLKNVNIQDHNAWWNLRGRVCGDGVRMHVYLWWWLLLAVHGDGVR